MTPNKIVSAYKAIHELSSMVFPYKVSRNIASLKKRLTEEFDTVAAMEKAMVDKYDGKPHNGSFKFPDEKKAESFRKEYDAAMQQDDEIKLPVVDLSRYMDMVRISPNAVEALEGLVIFEKEDSNG